MAPRLRLLQLARAAASRSGPGGAPLPTVARALPAPLASTLESSAAWGACNTAARPQQALAGFLCRRWGAASRAFSADGGAPTDGEAGHPTGAAAEAATQDDAEASGDGTEDSVALVEGAEAAEVPPHEKKELGKRDYLWGKGPTNNLNEMMVDLEDYLDSLPDFPSDEPIYDLPTLLGEDYERDIEFAQAVAEDSRIAPELLKVFEVQPQAAPYPGARQILRWTQTGVLKSVWGNEAAHPLNRKVACRVHMRELQEEAALSNDAVKHIIAVCGPRYTPKTGVLRLTSDRYREREDNRRDIVDTIRALVKEGHARFPNPHKDAQLAAHRAACAAEAEAKADEARAAAAAGGASGRGALGEAAAK
eukprot:jgi/Tetstr1/429401/TSEL_019312.t1